VLQWFLMFLRIPLGVGYGASWPLRWSQKL
jgi:hypothetical protein